MIFLHLWFHPKDALNDWAMSKDHDPSCNFLK